MNGDSLPEEIVFDILTRLPVKSIYRFKCVCKSWLSTVSTSKFIDSHFDRYRSHPKLLISIWTSGEALFDGEESRESFFIADRQDAELEKKEPLILRHRVTLPVEDVHTSDSLPVTGLSLSICSPDLIVITNPITKGSVAFPRAFPEQDGCRRSVCFGFDPVDGKHKIVESQLIIKESTFSVERMEHRVLAVSDSGNWRSVEEGPIVQYNSKQEVCVNGVIYYPAVVDYYHSAATTKKEQCIVAFNVRSEKFKVATLSITGRSSYSPNPYRYVEFEGKLAIVDYPYSNKNGDVEGIVPALDLWVLEDFENQVWSLKFSCLPSFALTRMLIGTTIEGELIFVEFGNRDKPFILPQSTHYEKTIDLGGEEDVPFSLCFLDMKTGSFRNREVHLPPEYPLTGKVRIKAASHIERL